MDTPRTSVRRAGLIGVALALLAGASACSRGPLAIGPAATVNGAEISQQEVTELAEANRSFYSEAKEFGLDTQGQYAARAKELQPLSTDTLTMGGAVEALDALIRRDIIRTELRRRDALPTKADVATARTTIESSLEGGKEELAKFNKDFIAFTVESKALDTALRQAIATDADKDNVTLTPAEQEAKMQELFASAAPSLPLCLNAIQTETEPEATAARARVEGGEDFGAVATDLAPEGVEVAEGGFATCLSFEDAQTQLGQDFSAAKAGDLVGPIALPATDSSAASYLLLQIDGTDGPTYEQLLPQLQAAVPLTPAPTDPTTLTDSDISAFLAGLTAKAEVTVDPMYGSWNDKTGALEAPTVPVEPTTPPTSKDEGTPAAPAAAAGS